MNATGDLLSRRQLFEELGIWDSNERRKRKQGGPEWPPHLCIGKKISIGEMPLRPGCFVRKRTANSTTARPRRCGTCSPRRRWPGMSEVVTPRCQRDGSPDGLRNR